MRYGAGALQCRHSPSEYHKTRVCYVALSEDLTITEKPLTAHNLPTTTMGAGGMGEAQKLHISIVAEVILELKESGAVLLE